MRVVIDLKNKPSRHHFTFECLLSASFEKNQLYPMGNINLTQGLNDQGLIFEILPIHLFRLVKSVFRLS